MEKKNKSELDFAELLQTAAIAYSGTRRKIEELTVALKGIEEYRSDTFLVLCKELELEAKKLVTVSQSYHALLNARDHAEVSLLTKGAN